MPTAGTAVRRRPKDRNLQILAAARELFVELGYRNVSMAQIAERVGITAGALYRHFSNKSVLLDAVITASLDDVVPAFEPTASLADVLAESCRKVVARRNVGTLWWRESRNLPEDLREALRVRLRAVNGQYADCIRTQRPTLSEPSAQELAWGVQSILASVGSHSPRIGDVEFASVLTRACEALSAVELSPSRAVPERRPTGLEPASKRESLLRHAVALFGEKGYDATGLDDIGAAAGVTGPNLYGYFENKADILQAAVERGTSALWLLLHAVLRQHDEPRHALSELVAGYVQLAIDRTILTSLLLTERQTLTDVARIQQREYVAEWVALLRAARADLDEGTARVLVHTTLGVIHTMPEIESRQANGGFPADLAAMAMAVLYSN
jgi:AcrR family transcriptional regulator